MWQYSRGDFTMSQNNSPKIYRSSPKDAPSLNLDFLKAHKRNRPAANVSMSIFYSLSMVEHRLMDSSWSSPPRFGLLQQRFGTTLGSLVSSRALQSGCNITCSWMCLSPTFLAESLSDAFGSECHVLLRNEFPFYSTV